ncbi:MAG: hypothetical protein F7C32_02240 [Desulfurococcales archaeon]|nr:hypothetical protein [Desulfurococcales archaeon]
MPAGRKIKNLLFILVVLAWVFVLVLRIGFIYTRFRVKLWWWRNRSSRRFKKKIKYLPRGLRGELQEEYCTIIKRVRVPGLLDVFGVLRKSPGFAFWGKSRGED